jgi:hypothetical protein
MGLKRFNQPSKIRHTADLKVIECPRRCFRDDARQSYGTTFWDEGAVHAGSFSGPQNGPDIVRILKPIQYDEERRFATLLGGPYDVFHVSIALGRHHCDHALMLPMRDQSIQRWSRLQMNWHACGLRQLRNVTKLAILSDKQKP